MSPYVTQGLLWGLKSGDGSGHCVDWVSERNEKVDKYLLGNSNIIKAWGSVGEGWGGVEWEGVGKKG